MSRGNNPSATYPDRTEGKAVFFSPLAGKSFYFEPAALNWNFSHNNGTDPGGESTPKVLNGIFYYHKEFFDQSPEQPIQAKFLVHVERAGSLYTHVAFYAPEVQGEKSLLGEFFAKDPDNIVAGFEGRDEPLTGEWNVVHNDSLADRLRRKYAGREAPADALFYRSGTGKRPSLYLTVEKLGWGFLHGVNPPTNPGLSGILFYNEDFFDREESEDPESIKAAFFVEQGKEDNERYVLIKLITEDEELLGEFLAIDPDNISKDLLDQRKTGQWKNLPPRDLEADLRRKYHSEQVSDALLYKGDEDSSSQSFHLQVYRRGWEFWDNTFTIGHRLPGSLFFNDPIFRHRDTEPIETSYYIERKRGKHGYYALVKFYASGSDDVVWGEFLAFDPANRAGEAGLLDKFLDGEWKTTGYTLLTANVFKEQESTEITLSILGHVATIECNREDEIFCDAFDVEGVVTTKTLGNHGDLVRWYKDRAIFYRDSTTEDFTSFFFPENQEDAIGSQDDLKMGVTWKYEGSRVAYSI